MFFVVVFYTDEVVQRSLFLNDEDSVELADCSVFHTYKAASRQVKKYLEAGYLVAMYFKRGV